MSNCGYNNGGDGSFRNDDLAGCSGYGKTCSRDVKTDGGDNKQPPITYGWRYYAPQSSNIYSVRDNTIPNTYGLINGAIHQPNKVAHGYPATGLQEGDDFRYNPAINYRTHTHLCNCNTSRRPRHRKFNTENAGSMLYNICYYDQPRDATNQMAPVYQESCSVFVTVIIILVFIVLIAVCIKVAKSIKKT